MKICLVSAVRMAASRAKFDEFVDFLLILQCLDWRKRLLEHEIFQKNPARHKMYKCEGGGAGRSINTYQKASQFDVAQNS